MIRLNAFITLAIIASSTASTSALAQSSSSSESYYRGPGSMGANVFVPKYNQRLQNWNEQINKAQAHGWLTAAEVASFKAEHARLLAAHSALEARSYPKAETDALEKEFTAFNASLSKAMSKVSPGATPAIPATPGTPGSGATPATPAVPPAKPKAVAPAAKKTVTKTTTKSKKKKTVTKKTVSTR